MVSKSQAWLNHAHSLRLYIPEPPSAYAQLGIQPMAPRLRQQLRSRSQILGTARAMMGEAGFDNVRVTKVAERAGVSLQTLYNLVGSRAEMLERASCEWVEQIAYNAEAFCDGRALNPIFVMIDLFWAGAVLNKAYATGVVRSRVGEGVSGDAFIRTTQRIICRQLAVISANGGLVRWADMHKLAHALARASHACVREWTAAPYDGGVFRDAVVNACGLLLRGSLSQTEASKLERCFDLGWQSNLPIKQ